MREGWEQLGGTQSLLWPQLGSPAGEKELNCFRRLDEVLHKGQTLVVFGNVYHPKYRIKYEPEIIHDMASFRIHIFTVQDRTVAEWLELPLHS